MDYLVTIFLALAVASVSLSIGCWAIRFAHDYAIFQRRLFFVVAAVVALFCFAVFLTAAGFLLKEVIGWLTPLISALASIIPAIMLSA